MFLGDGEVDVAFAVGDLLLLDLPQGLGEVLAILPILFVSKAYFHLIISLPAYVVI